MKTLNTLSGLGINSTSRVLVCMPHPDDEAVFTSGIIQKIIAAHIPLRCITFTRGEQSTLRFTLSPDVNLAAARIKEQTNAYRSLGVTDFDILDYPDGGLEKYPKDIKSQIKQELSNFKATHVVTLEPDGIYGHPDHIALSQYVTQSAGSATVLYATVAPRYIMPSARHMAKKSTIQPLKPTCGLVLTPTQAWVKITALLSHRSQFLHFPRVFLSLAHFLQNDMLFHEYYAYKGGSHD
jgi:LmbE family N-acetylglucosaminyl deacetylase